MSAAAEGVIPPAHLGNRDIANASVRLEGRRQGGDAIQEGTNYHGGDGESLLSYPRVQEALFVRLIS